MTNNLVNQQWLLANRPTTEPQASNFELHETPVTEPADGQILVRTLWLSVDPYMRGRMRDVPSYVPPVQIGEVMTGGGVGEVIASKAPDFAVGDIVESMLLTACRAAPASARCGRCPREDGTAG